MGVGRGGRSWERRKPSWDKPTKGVAPIGFPGSPPRPLPRGCETSAHRRSRTGTQPPPHLLPPARRVSKPRPRARAWGRSRRQASAIYPERRRRRTLAGNRHVSGALRRRLLAAAAAGAEGWRRPRRGFTGWNTLRADAPLARNAVRVSPRTRSAWPLWCRCGGAGPGAQGGAAEAAVWVRGRRAPPAAHGNGERRAGKACGATAAVLEAHRADPFRGIVLTLQEKPGKSEPLSL